MATKKEFKSETVEASVLRDCSFGNAGDVVELSAEQAELGATHGMLDMHPEAVKQSKKSKGK